MESTDLQQQAEHLHPQDQYHHHYTTTATTASTTTTTIGTAGYSYSPPPNNLHEQHQLSCSYGSVSTATTGAYHFFHHHPNGDVSNPSPIFSNQIAGRSCYSSGGPEEVPCASSGCVTPSVDDNLSFFYQSPDVAVQYHNDLLRRHHVTVPEDLGSPNVLSHSNFVGAGARTGAGTGTGDPNIITVGNFSMGAGHSGNCYGSILAAAAGAMAGAGSTSSSSTFSQLLGLSNSRMSSPPTSSNVWLMSNFLGLNPQPPPDYYFSTGNNINLGFAGVGDHVRPTHLLPTAAAGYSYSPFSDRLNKLASTLGSNNDGSSSSSSATGIKRTATDDQSRHASKASLPTSAKKKSTGSKNSAGPPLKVRKEKLGDRIAALHQLVSPFGKTDTASVLTEAIGYIQFLQDQIHTLCLTNVKPSQNRPCSRITHSKAVSSDQEGATKGGIATTSHDLRSRGLCLVPLSWTSFIPVDQVDATPHHHFF